MTIIAHRGWWWPEPERQNTPAALVAALRQGWAIEFDVRELDGRLVLQHDEVAPAYPLDDLYVAFDALPAGDDARLFWHPKDAPALDRIGRLLAEHPAWLARSLIVDVELLDNVPPFPAMLPCLTRISEHEGESAADAVEATWAHGLWLDTFSGTAWCVASDFGDRPVYLVSPELHGHPLDLCVVKAFGNIAGICTDVPQLFAGLEREHVVCTPVNKWWGD